MEIKEIEFLFGEEYRSEVERNIGRDPLEIALDGRVHHAREVASEVKYLQRAASKLPSYYAARAFLPQRAFEQSSSEACAAHKQAAGRTAVDLTCGLGVDSLYLAKHFARVVALERDPVLAEIVRRNFRLLGADNIEVVCTSAEDFARGMERVDAIFVDPDRRSADGHKMVCLEDCSPNLAELLPILKAKCKTVVVKLSPLFDIDEAVRLFGPSVEIDTVSMGGECKELLATLTDEIAAPRIKVSVLGRGSFTGTGDAALTDGFGADYGYIITPDTALRKARLAGEYFRSAGIDCFAADGYGFCNTLPEGELLGRTDAIAEILPYRPKELRRKVPRAIMLSRHGFPQSTQMIFRALGTREGGTERWVFTEIESKLWAIRLK